ncbi:SLIT and NTRK-like protein 2 isoform X2 [Diorhabda sublineata]|uniref:SLIT and NTRK-like protein 2 isoform X2 n=1 Tax=Diorhabda sublineata TaxID=1163346 RepID=UPI0024E0BC29|nr:SLIT and NTRK-like protein 2 isoform X2 [Diorhabda sublineata]
MLKTNILLASGILYATIVSTLGYSKPMECKYGERGSLTAICYNASSFYFRITNYRFDYLDETLECVNCNLTSLEQGTFDIPGNEIKNLDIRNSFIRKIWPKAFIGMIYMEKLLLAHNPIEIIYPEAFLGVRKVKLLDMEDTVSDLEPKVFQELHLLEVLQLNKNTLTKIKPGTFDGLYNLKILDLSENNLQSVNNSFDPLINLRILNLKNNHIKQIYGDEFIQLKSLYLLNLENNGLYNFTSNMPADNQMRIINLSFNNLSADSFAPNTFSNLNSVEELNLNNNNLGDIPVGLFRGLYKLTTLNLNDNSITEINTGRFTGLPHLRVLNVSRNKIRLLKVTGRFALPSLITLDVSDNKIVDVDYMNLILRTPRLKHIDLRDNKLSCKTIAQLEALLETDSVTFYITNTTVCPKLVDEEVVKLIDTFTERLDSNYVNNNVMIWMFVLMTVAILLTGVMFYIQIFILRFVVPGVNVNNFGYRRNTEQV